MVASDKQVATRLLQYLRGELNNASIQYHVPPTRLKGGETTTLYRFQLTTDSPELSQPLILRVYPSWLTDYAVLEGYVQNALSQIKYPSPQAFFIGTDASILGGQFLIMAFVPGDPMWNTVSLDDIPLQLATAQTALHRIDPQPLINMLNEHGIQRTFTAFTSRLHHRIETHNMTWIRPGLQWVCDHQPTQDRIVICHNDFHPMNILVHQGQIRSVLDWSTVSFGEPEWDVANTMNRLSTFWPLLYPTQVSTRDASHLMTRYYQQYTQLSPLNHEKIVFYEAAVSIMVLILIEQGAFSSYANQLKAVNYQRFQQISCLTL